MIESGSSDRASKDCKDVHKLRYSRIAWIPKAPDISRIHVLPWSASRTVLRFRFLATTAACTAGARVRIDDPWIQLSSQKSTFIPLPTRHVKETWSRFLSFCEIGTLSPCHGFSGDVLSCQAQRHRSASPMHSRSGTPNPPYDLGAQTRAQATRQLPPLALAFPDGRKPRRTLSIPFITHFGTLMAISR
ncbi:Os01g0885500 [Oryza sativa Japonica Group]|uniref:Os01g0885500 protein n=1 Tax=Oryza sativa subsp. japonica TaxID=39947 RepID=A0A0P0VB92_ORYSJ|nr:hypothetical protein EE612_007236 [Oryza sativa]BAS75603.1 Os01g0885500 [Oryza sativa Japonica Group]